jgi:subtilisin-like proprotein convertase family protein
MRFFTLFLCLFAGTLSIHGQNTSIWKPIDERTLDVAQNTRQIIPATYRTLALDLDALKTSLQQAPNRFAEGAVLLAPTIEIPMPDGSTTRFQVYSDPVMEEGLAVQFPYIQSFTGFSKDDPTAYLRFDYTQFGFHAMVLSAKTGTMYIDPYSKSDTKHYISYWRSEFYKTNTKFFNCEFQGEVDIHGAAGGATLRAGDCKYRNYRLALACTGEYATFCGGTVAAVVAAMNTSMTRVNGVYEKEVGVHMNLVANNTAITYLVASSDPYTNTNGSTMLGQNQTTCDNVIGTANYDIGHVFSTGGGGVAYLNSPCSTNKARGVTGSSSPVGDPFDIDYVAHEMGHQFGGNHTFNATTGSCSGNFNSGTTVEPGSGTTIMAYAGICGTTNNVQSNSDAYFHGVNLTEIAANVVSGTSSTCAALTTPANLAPTANAGLDYSIPKGTPFTLSGSGTDPDGNALTYCWEQTNANYTSANPPTATQTSGAVFRSLSPVSVPTRTFPKMATIVANTTSTWEVLPTVARALAFRLTVRDNQIAGGCTAEDNSVVNVINTSAPFLVTVPTLTGISYPVGSSQTVTWDVVGTTAAPINCANVDILLSTDGGLTYPITLLANTPNDGSEIISIPNNPTTTARIMVKGSDNIFFDISNNNFTIVFSGPTYTMTTATPSAAACATNTASYTINTAALNGFTDPVSFTTTGLPAGISQSFTAQNITPGNTSVLNVNNIGGVASGTYSFTINSSAGAVTQTNNATLIVGNAPTTPPALATPADNAVSQPLRPILTWVAVPDATSYQVKIATDQTYTTNAQSFTATSTSFTLPSDLMPNTLYYWGILPVNSCGSTPFFFTNSFTTANITCNSYASANVPLTIPTTVSAVTSTLPITSGGTVTDVNVENLVGTHTYISDLRFTVKSPDNTAIIVMDPVCTNEDNFNIKFDDGASNLYSTIPCPPTSALYYVPKNTLAGFNGKEMLGTWSLVVNDISNQDGGSLTGWGLRICVSNYQAIVLPVELLGFKASANKRDISLTWNTGSEKNNRGFELLRRSEEENTFHKIAWIEGNGTTTKTSHYDYTDTQVEKGKTYYYRLRKLDHDNKEMLSAIEVASLKNKGLWDIQLQPNPAHEQVELTLWGSDITESQARILYSNGQVIREFTVTEKNNTLNTNDLTPGVYFIQVISEGNVVTKKLIIE